MTERADTMTRPPILDLDIVVVPREATDEMSDAGDAYWSQQDHIEQSVSSDGMFSAMLSASPYPTAWDDVRKYVRELEESVAFTMTDTSRMLRKSDIEDVCPHPDECFYEAERARCGPCAVKASKLAGIEIDDTHSHLPEVCRLRREVKAAEARIAELEKRLADAERVIEPFAKVKTADGYPDGFLRSPDECVMIFNATDALGDTPNWEPVVTVGHLRAARAYVEGK